MADSNSTRLTTIYTLSDPETGEVRYVGKTACKLKTRFSAHLSGKEKGHEDKSHKANWIRSLLDRGLIPVISAIEEGIGNDWIEREQYWIAYYRGQGARLTNLTDGGEGVIGWTHAPEFKSKMAAIASGRKKTPEELIKIGEKSRATWADPAYRERQRIIQTGKKRTVEQRAAQSAAQTGKKQSIETRAKMSASAKARFSDPEVRAKHSSSMRTAYNKPEVRSKLSKTTATLWENPEYRSKVIAARHNKSYFDIACERIENEQRQQKLFL